MSNPHIVFRAPPLSSFSFRLSFRAVSLSLPTYPFFTHHKSQRGATVPPCPPSPLSDCCDKSRIADPNCTPQTAAQRTDPSHGKRLLKKARSVISNAMIYKSESS